VFGWHTKTPRQMSETTAERAGALFIGNTDSDSDSDSDLLES